MAKSKYEKNFPERAEAYMNEGHTEAELAKHLGVSNSTLAVYKNKYPDFLDAIKKGKVQTDENVENALLKRAMGYEYEEVRKEYIEDEEGNQTGRVRVIRQIKQVQPDTTAQIFWLKNRRPDDWRDRKHHEHTGKDGKAIKFVEVSYQDD